ncbi:MAG: tetratricopeptide repeat protein [Candidatus Aegiribacteria sp.]|nr:tetratricopeptide repeat protein [Candidatus Aegiribacteria sp.]
MTTTGQLGRQLLSIRNRITSEKELSSLRKLRKREIQLLTELGNISAAVASGENLISDYPLWPAGYSILANVLCRARKWEEAEKLFDKAANLYEEADNPDSAARLRMGPVYRLSEARNDFSKCLKLCGTDNELGAVLQARCKRQMNEKTSLPDACTDWLAGKLLLLEKVRHGRSPYRLYDEVVEWKSTEPEWRWRFIVESIEIWQRLNFNTEKWRKPVKDTAQPVLDPRFTKEWSILSHD